MANKMIVTNLKPVAVKLARKSAVRSAAAKSQKLRFASGLSPTAIKVFRLAKQQQKIQANVD